MQVQHQEQELESLCHGHVPKHHRLGNLLIVTEKGTHIVVAQLLTGRRRALVDACTMATATNPTVGDPTGAGITATKVRTAGGWFMDSDRRPEGGQARTHPLKSSHTGPCQQGAIGINMHQVFQIRLSVERGFFRKLDCHSPEPIWGS